MAKTVLIHLPGKKRSHLLPGQQPVVRRSVEAYNILVDIANETPLSISKVATEIIIQAKDSIEFDKEDADE